MPFWFEKKGIILPKELDRRRKLTEEDKEHIRHLYKAEKLGIREIARIYEKVCSRRLIQFILFPERLQEVRKHHKERGGWRKYYNKEANTRAIKKTRNHRKKVFGLIRKGRIKS